MKRRRRARVNPAHNIVPWLVVGGGLALLGVGVYFLTKPAAAASTAGATKALGPATYIGNSGSSGPGGQVVIGHLPDGSPFTRDWAAEQVCKLRALGHSAQAQPWADAVTANGGTLPC
jgi:hypothetical protein